MNLTSLKRAPDYKVEEWLKKSELNLGAYQIEKMRASEMVRFAPFKFYERREKEKVTIFWRLTIIAIPIYVILLFGLYPVTFLIRGKWGYSEKFHDNFHAAWMHKLNLG